jgi:hypothetical protein
MKTTTITNALRDAIRNSGLTYYRIGKATGITSGNMGHFMRGASLRLDKADRLAAYFGFRLVRDPNAAPPTPTPENLARPTLAKHKAKRTRRTNTEDKAK